MPARRSHRPAHRNNETGSGDNQTVPVDSTHKLGLQRHMQLQTVSFNKETDIRYEFQLETTCKNRFWYTLIAKFSGTYRPGSTGAPDAYFICGIAQTALAMWHPAALILDLRELSYTWGNDMDLVLDAGSGPNVPTAIVGSDACLPAIGTLIHGINSAQLPTDAENIFDSIEEAWEYVRMKA